MPKSNKCACGIRSKVHTSKGRRGQLPDVKTDRFGRLRPGRGNRVKKEERRWACGCLTTESGSIIKLCDDCLVTLHEERAALADKLRRGNF